jgi:hypothetical protein
MAGDPFNYGEEWAEIEGFPRYLISTEGRVFNKQTNREMRSSLNNYGHPKISLLTDNGRHTRSVAFLVARTFLEPPHELCDRIIYLNGDLSDFRAENLAWRPRWFGWKYSRQLKLQQPAYYRNLPVTNTMTGAEYENIVEAGMAEGLLFEQIWHSTYSGSPVYPYGSTWEVTDRV